MWLQWFQLKRNITVHIIKIRPFRNNLRRVDTICTVPLNIENSTLCLRVYLCCVILTVNSDYFLNRINWFLFVIQTENIYCEPGIHLSSRNAKVGSCDCHVIFRLSVCLSPYSTFEVFGRFSPAWYEGTGGHQSIILSYLTTQRTPPYEI